MAEHKIINSFVGLTFEYNYRVGESLDKYLDGLQSKKILGVTCPECERVLVPPRNMCGKCNTKTKKWVTLKPVGTLKNFTVSHVEIEQGEIKDREKPVIIGQIKLEGADSLLTARIEGVSPKDVKTGLKVKAVFKDTTEGTLQDLDHFEPVK